MSISKDILASLLKKWKNPLLVVIVICITITAVCAVFHFSELSFSVKSKNLTVEMKAKE